MNLVPTKISQVFFRNRSPAGMTKDGNVIKLPFLKAVIYIVTRAQCYKTLNDHILHMFIIS